VVDTDEPPLRIFFGKVTLGVATVDYESRLATWNKWQPVSIEAHGSERNRSMGRQIVLDAKA
jgi:hypothetical protein